MKVKRFRSILFALVLLSSMIYERPVLAKQWSNYNLYVSNETYSVDEFYSSSIRFQGKNVIIKGKLPIKNNDDELLETKRKCKIKISSKCKFYYGEGIISFKEMKGYVKDAGNNSYISFGIMVKKGKAVSMGLYS